MSALLGTAAWRYHAGRPGLAVLSVLGIAVGVAVVVGIDVANSSARRAFTWSSDAIAGTATHQVVGAGRGVPEHAYVDLRVQYGIRDAVPFVEGTVRREQDGSALSVVGIDPLLDASVRSLSSAEGFPDPVRLLADPGAVVVSRGTASRLGVSVSDSIRVDVDGRIRSLSVVGIIDPADPVTRQAWTDLVVGDVATAQEVLGMTGWLSRIDLDLEGEAALQRVRAALPPGLEVVPSASRTETLAQMTRAFELNLTALSYLALLVGLFLVYNIVSFSVVRRRIVIGRLRALGVDRRRIERTILAEALVLGLVGTLAGLGLGVLLGSGLVKLVVRSINDLYFVVSVEGVAVGAWTWMKGAALGVGATLVAAWGPARRAGRVPAAAVLRRSEEESRLRRRFGLLWAGAAASAATGMVLLVVGTGIVAGYAGLLGIVGAFALATPPTVDAMARLLHRIPLPMTWRMAVGSIRARLARISVAIAALALAVAAAVGVGIMVQSFRTTVETWLAYSLQADLYVQAPGVVVRRGGGTLDASLVRRMRSDPDVRAAYGVRRVEVPTEVGISDLLAIEHGPESRTTFRFRSSSVDDPWSALDGGRSVAVSEPFAVRHGIDAGDSLAITTPSGERAFHVAAVYFDYGSDLGAVMVGRPAFDRLFADSLYNGLALYLHPGRDAESVGRRLEREAGAAQQVVVRSNAALRNASLEVFDRTFAVTFVLRLLAVVVAFVGILSALSALLLDRSFELGVLRAMGLRPSGIRRLALAESGVMGLFAGLLSLPLGVALAAGLVYVINRRSFGWTLQFEVDPMLLLQAVGVAVGAGVLAAVIPAVRAGRLPVADLLRTGAAVVVLAVAGGCASPTETPRAGIGEALRVDTTGYARATGPRTFRFPEDHGAHPDYRLEWWYFTGNLESEAGEPFGYQFTVFRTALRPPGARDARESDLAAEQLYMAHLAVTDAAGGRFEFAERFSRDGGGLAGATGSPFRVWLEDWEVSGPEGLGMLRVRAMDATFGIELDLVPAKPVVLQGDAGFSPKGDEPGQASFYYAITRLETRGRIVLDGRQIPVKGLSWFDREWSTSLLSEDQAGWDWFSLQLDNGLDLMFFQLRGASDGSAAFVDGSLVGPSAERLPFDPERVRLSVTDRWTSSASGIRYPSGWRLASDLPALDLRVVPLRRDQELDVSVRYWEGAVRVEGTVDGRPVSGRGYVEMTGYEEETARIE